MYSWSTRSASGDPGLGDVPGEEARAKVAENRSLRKRRAQLQAMYGTDWNKGQADLSGMSSYTFKAPSLARPLWCPAP